MKRILAVVLFLSAWSPSVMACQCIIPVGDDLVKSADDIVANEKRVFFGTIKSYELISQSRKGFSRQFWVTVSVDKNIKGVADQETVDFYWNFMQCGIDPEISLGRQFLFWNSKMYSELFDRSRTATKHFPIVLNPDKPILFYHDCTTIWTRTDYELANWAEQPRRTYLRFLGRLWQLAEQNE